MSLVWSEKGAGSSKNEVKLMFAHIKLICSSSAALRDYLVGKNVKYIDIHGIVQHTL